MGRVHVVGAAAFVTRFLPEFEEFLDIHVPEFEIATERAGSFSALIHR